MHSKSPKDGGGGGGSEITLNEGVYPLTTLVTVEAAASGQILSAVMNQHVWLKTMS